MDKRIATAIMAMLLLLVVTAAYAPNMGTGTTEEQVVTNGDSQALLQSIDKKLDTVLDNQKLIFERLKALETSQTGMSKDVKYIRSKTR
jgi:uncharacterized protein YpuA (DUF1002 family)